MLWCGAPYQISWSENFAKELSRNESENEFHSSIKISSLIPR